MRLSDRLRQAANLTRLAKQYGTFLVMLPALWALVLAGRGNVPVSLVIVFIAGSFIMRSAGVVINDIADRRFDGHVERTKNRPLASGKMRVGEAVTILVLLVFVAVCLAFFLNGLAIALSAVGLALAFLYPFTKRFFDIPQLFLGLAFGWGVMIAWAAAAGTVEATTIVLFFSTVCWVTAYDTVYALLDKEDDVKIGIKSAAVLFGRSTWRAVAALYAVSVAALVIVGRLQGLGSVYYAAMVVVAGLLAAQVYYVKSSTDPKTTFRAFESNVLVGVVVLAGMVAHYIHL